LKAGEEEGMGRLFGTDGIRGIAHEEPITPEMSAMLGRAVTHFCKREETRAKIVVGRDTRISGKMLEEAIVSGICSLGGDAILVGELPTPGVAFLIRDVGANAGIMISASHNPHEYNGFKIFSHEGYKLSEAQEAEIEGLTLGEDGTFPNQSNVDSGEVQDLDDASERYVAFLKDTIPEKNPYTDMKIVLDCANGATYRVAPILFESLSAKTECICIHPDGKNINKDCGSEHPERLRKRVLETGADAGLAFDGDGDRLIAVDEKGSVLTGDEILTICARMLKDQGELTNNLVVSTVMSNMGFLIALRELGIEQIATQVGDRHVMEEMRARKAILGGEDSGHIIFLHHHTTGDGLLSALQLLWAIKRSGRSLSQLSALMTRFPQSLTSVAVKQKPEITSVPELVQIVEKVEKRLGAKGRVLVRYSGTEPVCRIMVEGEKTEEIDEYSRQIADVVKRHLG
jgi:phosphoglucosamine mutase